MWRVICHNEIIWLHLLVGCDIKILTYVTLVKHTVLLNILSEFELI